MAEQRDFLVELGAEELPPKALQRLSRAFRDELVQGLATAGLSHGTVHAYATPRRLAVLVEQLAAQQPDQSIERRGPALAAAFDGSGKPTPAALGFARSCGVDIEALQTLETDKGAWLVYRGEQRGAAATALLPQLVQQALDKLPIPKRMRWGSSRTEFVRPVHWLVMLFGDAVVPGKVLGIDSGNISHGHRFHAPQPIQLRSPAEYSERLAQEGRVIVSFAERRQRVLAQVQAAAAEAGGRAVIDDELLDEVTALVEWPVAIVGRFEEEFLEVPAEALISSMQGHQRYFPVRDAQDRLLPIFITVANIESRDPEVVRQGNERVIRPRLADAAFFWNQDRKRPLADRVEPQREIVFQQRLGSVYAKTERVAALCEHLANVLGSDATQAARAGWLSRCDLSTEMVGEFPELQGIMGRYYAVHDQEPAAVADALDEQYRPRFAGDAVAETRLGQILAVADRADTLVGIFAIGREPSGDKDPFALRRAALGLMRTIIERELDVDLRELLATAARHLPSELKAGEKVEQVFDFCLERLRGYYADQDIATELFDAVAALRPVRPLDFHHRLLACQAFVRLPEAEALAAANKRIRNILRKATEEVPATVDQSALQEAEEKALQAAVEAAAVEVEPLLAQHRYASALTRLAQLRGPVDQFFDKVLVMADDPRVRANRLALLQRLEGLFLRIADISRLPGS
ncbi:MAG TPA: glycine--tRNA ligase subunit beta [Gammaproteobacteria bacterium]|nr:glycine--tRNA ligase subunit beta [Gammaproteobacteria bacterium]